MKGSRAACVALAAVLIAAAAGCSGDDDAGGGGAGGTATDAGATVGTGPGADTSGGGPGGGTASASSVPGSDASGDGTGEATVGEALPDLCTEVPPAAVSEVLGGVAPSSEPLPGAQTGAVVTGGCIWRAGQTGPATVIVAVERVGGGEAAARQWFSETTLAGVPGLRQITGVGDEAAFGESTSGTGLFVRQGDTIVSIGSEPGTGAAPSTAALVALADAVLETL